MIEVIIRHAGSEAELGRITIENVSDEAGEFGNYSVKFGVEKVASVGVHQRGLVNFPRTKYNVLGLLLQALNTLEPRELELEGWNEEQSTPRLRALRGNIFRRHW